MSITYTVIWSIVLAIIAIIGFVNGDPMIAIPVFVIMALIIGLCIWKQCRKKKQAEEEE